MSTNVSDGNNVPFRLDLVEATRQKIADGSLDPDGPTLMIALAKAHEHASMERRLGALICRSCELFLNAPQPTDDGRQESKCPHCGESRIAGPDGQDVAA